MRRKKKVQRLKKFETNCYTTSAIVQYARSFIFFSLQVNRMNEKKEVRNRDYIS